jgi:hypothetical protein
MWLMVAPHTASELKEEEVQDVIQRWQFKRITGRGLPTVAELVGIVNLPLGNDEKIPIFDRDMQSLTSPPQ